MHYMVRDFQRDRTVSVYEVGHADFDEVFKALRRFAQEQGLDDCVVAVRDYAEDEMRDDGREPAAISKWKSKVEAAAAAGKPCHVRKPKLRQVDPMRGTAWVDSFQWKIREHADLKQIRFLFYDDGWPGEISVSKTGSVLAPTEMELSAHDRPRDGGKEDLHAAFRKFVEEL